MKRILITGVSRGAGKAYAEKFLRADWHVLGTSTAGTTDTTHKNLEVYALDLSRPEQIEGLAAQLIEKDIRFDAILNNAGINLSATEYPTKKLSAETLQKTLAVNLIGLADLTERLLSLVIRNGQIINISSGSGAFHPFIATGSPSYQISKAALNMYTKTLASRLQSEQISVWSFDPGWIRTDMGSQRAPKLPETAAEELYALVTSRPASGPFWQATKERDW